MLSTSCEAVLAEDGSITAVLGIDYCRARISILSSFCLPPKDRSSGLGSLCWRKRVIQFNLLAICTALWFSVQICSSTILLRPLGYLNSDEPDAVSELLRRRTIYLDSGKYTGRSTFWDVIPTESMLDSKTHAQVQRHHQVQHSASYRHQQVVCSHRRLPSTTTLSPIAICRRSPSARAVCFGSADCLLWLGSSF